MTADPEPPAGIDTTQPSAARVYDYVIGGTDNYPVDRAAAEAVRAVEPSAFESAVQNRAFLVRVVQDLTARGTTSSSTLGGQPCH